MKNKIALITGASRGIGKQIGLDLLDKDYHVIFNGRTWRNLDIIAEELRQKNITDFDLWEADLSNIDEIYNINTPFPDLDVLVLNAGMTDRTPFGEVSLSNWDKIFNTNLKVPFFLVQTLKDKIKPNGKIIFISSIAGCTTDSTSITYGVSKGAIHILVPNLAKAFASKNITVNAVCPAYIDSDWHIGKSKAQIERIANKHLVKRLGTIKEVSKAVLSIIDNDFINGQVVRVDGGFGIG